MDLLEIAVDDRPQQPVGGTPVFDVREDDECASAHINGAGG